MWGDMLAFPQGDKHSNKYGVINFIPQVTGSFWTLVIRGIISYLHVIRCDLRLANRQTASRSTGDMVASIPLVAGERQQCHPDGTVTGSGG